ncbi:N-acetylneuraminate lyase [Pholidichthys leucotaenia]
MLTGSKGGTSTAVMTTPARKLTGLVAAPFTPLTPQGEINLSVIAPYIAYLLEEQGIKSVFVNGTTGESVSLSVSERKLLAAEWCQQAKGKMDQVVVHVGCMSLKDTQDLARHAAEIGADGIAVSSPSFFKPSTADALKLYLQAVASAAPTLPFYYYDIPGFTGVKVNVRDVIEGIEKLIPAFGGTKFTGTNLMDLGLCIVRSQPQWSVLYGVDEQLLAALSMGVHGAVGSTYNYIGSHINKMILAFENGNSVQAREIQAKLQDFLDFAFKRGFDVGVNKQLMAAVSGLSLGPPRLPLLPRSQDHIQPIVEKFQSVFVK